MDTPHRSPGLNLPDLSETRARDLPAAAPAPTHASATPDPGRGDTPGASGRTGPALAVGDVLAGRYEILAEVGRGGMGVVYAARDRHTGADVAVKVLLPHLLRDPAARNRFAAEMEAASRLDHPNVVAVLDRAEADGRTFLVMELLQGWTLRAELADRQKRDRRYSADEARHLADQLCDALSYAHAHGVVHRDVKPENVWVDDGTVKLMDFGVARLLSPAQLTSTGVALGTAYYMAPEQHKMRADVDHRADQYATGVVLYELLTGDVPQGVIRPPHELRRGIPVGMSWAVMRALEGRPEDRHPDMAAFKAALAGGGGATARVGRWAAVAAGVTAAAAAVALAVVFSGRFGPADAGPAAPAAARDGAAAQKQLAAARAAVEALKDHDRRWQAASADLPETDWPPGAAAAAARAKELAARFPNGPLDGLDAEADAARKQLDEVTQAAGKRLVTRATDALAAAQLVVDKGRAVRRDVAKMAADADARAVRLEAKKDDPGAAAELALVRAVRADLKSFADRLDAGGPPADRLDAAATMLEAGKALVKDQPAEAHRRLTAAQAEADAYLAWWKTAQAGLREVEDGRAYVHGMRAWLRTRPDGGRWEAALVAPASRSLDAVPGALAGPAPDPSVVAAREAIGKLRRLAELDAAHESCKAVLLEVRRPAPGLPARVGYVAAGVEAAAADADRAVNAGNPGVAVLLYQMAAGERPVWFRELAGGHLTAAAVTQRDGDYAKAAGHWRAAAEVAAAHKLDDVRAGAAAGLYGCHTEHAERLLADGKFVESARAWEAAVALDAKAGPGLTRCLTAHAKSFQDAGKYPEALAAWARVIPHDPTTAHRNRAVCLQRIGQLTEALTSVGEAFTAARDAADADLYVQRAEIRLTLMTDDLAVVATDLNEAAKRAGGDGGTRAAALAAYVAALRGEPARRAADQAVADAPDDPWARLARSAVRVGAKEWAGAIEDCDAALDRSPKLTPAYAVRAAARIGTGSPQAALDDCKEALTAVPTSRPLLARRALAHARLGKTAEATADADAALKDGAKHLDAFVARATVLVAQGKRADAVKDLDEAVRLTPRDLDLLLTRVRLNADLWRQAAVAADATTCLDIAPDHIEALLLRSYARSRNGDPAGALADADRAADLAPDRAAPHVARASAFFDRNNLSGAKAAAEKAIALEPDHADGHAMRALVRLEEEADVDAALKDADRAVTLNDKSPLAYRARAAVWLERKDYDNTLRYATRATELFPGYLPARDLRHRAYDAKGMTRSAADELRLMGDLTPDSAIGYMRAARYAESNEWANWVVNHTKEVCTNAIRIDPRLAEAYALRGRFGSDRPAQFDDLNKALELDPEKPKYYVWRAVVYRADGRENLALQDCDRALRKNDKYEAAHTERGEIYLAAMRAEDALEAFEMSLKIRPTPQAYTGRAKIWASRNEHNRATADCNEAIQLNRRYAPAYGIRSASFRHLYIYGRDPQRENFYQQQYRADDDRASELRYPK